MGFIEGDHFDDEECLALLGRAQFGRIALSLRAVPVVLPVRYALSGDEILFALSVGQLAAAFPRTVVTLHADGFDEDNGQRWTVFAVGHARRVEGSDSPGLAGVSLSSGSDIVSVERGDLFRLQPEIFSGRWIESL